MAESYLDTREEVEKACREVTLKRAHSGRRIVQITRRLVDRAEKAERRAKMAQAEIETLYAIRAQDRSVGMLLVELAGHLGMRCEVNSESILRTAIQQLKELRRG